MDRPQILLVSTDKDISLSLFYEAEASKVIEPRHIFYGSASWEGDLADTQFQYIYFRDPFNDSNLNIEDAKATFQVILKKYPNAYIVDGLKHFEDMLFEDKWRQYKLFNSLMPQTSLLKDHRSVDFSANMVKKRISARSKGIFTSQDQFPADAAAEDYIVQSKLVIDKEFRIFMLGGQIVRPLGIKSSKLRSSVALIGTEDNVPSEIIHVCSEVHTKTNFDFMGLDIAQTKRGYFLLEVNRSCQFKGYNRVSQINLATTLNRYLIKQLEE